MRFRVSRTSRSQDYRDDRPCDGAEWLPYTRVSVHTDRSPEEYDARWKDFSVFGQPVPKWHEEGSNHRPHPRGIARDFPAEGWFVDLEMGDLMGFIAGNGRVVVSPPGDDGMPTIEIYDSYRE